MPIRSTAISSLAQLMVLGRQHRGARTGVRRRLPAASSTSTSRPPGVIQQRGSALLRVGAEPDRRSSICSCCARSPMPPTASACSASASARPPSARCASCWRRHARRRARTSPASCRQAERAVEWAQSNATLAFAEVWAPWTYLLPQTAAHPRRHPAQLAVAALCAGRAPARRLRRRARSAPATISSAPRSTPTSAPSTPGWPSARFACRAEGRRLHARRDRRAARDAGRSRSRRRHPHAGRGQRAVARPAAGARSRHSQRRARLRAPTRKIAPHDGQQVFFIVTPGGRVIIKEAAAMTPQDRAVYDGVHAQPGRRSRRQPRRRRTAAAHRPRQDRPDQEHADRPDRGPAQGLGPLLRPQGGLPRRAQAPLSRPRRARDRRAVRRLLRPLSERRGRRAREAAPGSAWRRPASGCRTSSSVRTRSSST